MKIGVSGASGHLGRATVAELVQRPGGHEVVAISRTPETITAPGRSPEPPKLVIGGQVTRRWEEFATVPGTARPRESLNDGRFAIGSFEAAIEEIRF